MERLGRVENLDGERGLRGGEVAGLGGGVVLGGKRRVLGSEVLRVGLGLRRVVRGVIVVV